MRKEFKKSAFSIRVEMYPVRFIFLFNYDTHISVFKELPNHIRYKESIIDLEKKIAEYNFRSFDGAVFETDGYIVTMLSRYENTPPMNGILQHELLHAVFSAAKYLGFKYSEDSEEFYTYMQGHLTEKVLKKLHESK